MHLGPHVFYLFADKGQNVAIYEIWTDCRIFFGGFFWGAGRGYKLGDSVH